ncbi:AraC family transcriptional regulator [Paenibacillus ginsengarvi]|nr:AraC family transcriptional regulator [Paenibacillus ginsengarvi]
MEPRRLTIADYMSQGTTFRLFRHKLEKPIDLHWHEFYELAFVYEGEGYQIWNGTKYKLGPGSLFLLTPADFHEIGPEPGSTMLLFNTILSEDILSEELLQLLFRGGEGYAAEVAGDDRELLVHEFERIWTECLEEREGSRIWVRGAMERILILLARHRISAEGRRAEGDHLKPSVRRALTYIHHHFRLPLTLDEAAKHAGMSTNYFSATFRKSTGIAFQNYLQALRLRFARTLLQASDLPVTDICYASGFNTLSHFERAFKKEFGAAPRSMRKETKASGSASGD